MGSPLVLVTGISGAGKSQAVRALEMAGYRCTDNLPPALLPALLESAPADRPVAAVIDARGTAAADIPGLVAYIRGIDGPRVVVYLDADDETLVRRFSETRKAHPLDTGEGVLDAIARERELLGELRDIADVIDTSDMRVDTLVTRVQEMVHAGRPVGPLPVTLASFGYKYGVPVEADWLLDARFTENPYYHDALRNKTGHDDAVRDFVLASPLVAPFLDGAATTLEALLTGYAEQGKPSLLVAIGCTGGRHRSVVLAEELATRLRKGGADVAVRHRDIDR